MGFNLDCQLDRIENCLGNKLGMSMKEFLHWVGEVGELTLSVGGTVPWAVVVD